MANKNITTVIENSIPYFIRLQYPNFVEFIKLYYSNLEEEGSAYEFIANQLDYANVDKTTLEYLDNFSAQYLPSIPDNILPDINKRTLLKHIKEYYQSIGNESSIKFLFRILFNESVDVYYPSDDILRVSDGKWQEQKIIKITNSNGTSITSIEGTEIRGSTSNAVGLVEKVNIYTASNAAEVAEIYLTDFDPIDKIDNFISGETVTATSLDGTKSFEEVIYHVIAGVDMLGQGMYNSPGDIIHVISTVGADARIRVGSVQEGSVDDVEIIKGGIDYAVNDVIFFDGNNESRGAKAKVSSVDIDGAITGIKIIDKGYSYDIMPSYVIDSVSGTGAILYPYSEDIGKIETVSIIDHGVRYNPVTTNTFLLQFYHTMHVYNDSWNSIEYNNNEILVGETSGARAKIIRFNRDTGIIVYDMLETNDFVENDVITGETTGATGFKVYQIWTAEGEITPGAIGSYRGNYINKDGFLDSDKYLQDSYYYQDYSYVLTTTRPRSEWFNYLKPNVHPAGTIVFGYGEALEIIKVADLTDEFISPTLESVRFYMNENDFDDTLWTPQLFGDRELATKPNTQEKDYKTYEDYVIEAGSIEQIVLDDDNTLLIIDNDTSNDHFLIGNNEPINRKDINTSIKAHLCYGSKIIYDIEGLFGLAIDATNEFLIDTTNFLET